MIAETIAQAKDAAEAVALDIEPLPAVISAREAVKPGAPQVWDDVPGNIALDYHHGDTAKVAEAFAKAAHVVKLPLINQRLVVNAIEPRSAIGEFDAKTDKVDAAFVQPRRLRPEEHAARHSRRAGRQSARAHRQCRRLVRHEGRASIRNMSASCTAPACSAGR